MMNMTSRIAFALAALALPAAPALAQAITVGMQVTDTAGKPVGTVTAIQGDNLVIKTDKHQALLARNSVTPANGKLLYSMTQAQLDAEIEQGLAAADASVKAGATVKGAGGTVVGTIESADANWVTVTIAQDKKLKLARAGVRGNADGTVTIGLTEQQVQAELDKAAQSAAASPGSSTGE
jgi:preprotein translocase subunit YajC